MKTVPCRRLSVSSAMLGVGDKMQCRMMQEHMDKSKDEHLDALATHGKTMMAQFATLSLGLTQISTQPIFISPPEIVLDKFELHKKKKR